MVSESLPQSVLEERSFVMPVSSKENDRRRNERVTVRNHVFALSKQPDEQLATVVDLSLEGLSMVYVCDRSRKAEIRLLDLFTVEDDCSLKNVPAQIIYDYEIDLSKNGFPEAKRKCGARFCQLTSLQRFQLSIFLMLMSWRGGQ